MNSIKQELNLKTYSVVAGYKSELFSEYKLNTFFNQYYETTHQVYSISCASSLSDAKEVVVITEM